MKLSVGIILIKAFASRTETLVLSWSVVGEITSLKMAFSPTLTMPHLGSSDSALVQSCIVLCVRCYSWVPRSGWQKKGCMHRVSETVHLLLCKNYLMWKQPDDRMLWAFQLACRFEQFQWDAVSRSIPAIRCNHLYQHLPIVNPVNLRGDLFWAYLYPKSALCMNPLKAKSLICTSCSPVILFASLPVPHCASRTFLSAKWGRQSKWCWCWFKTNCSLHQLCC